MLGCPAQDVESLIGGNALALHQNPDRLADYLPGGHRGAEVGGSSFVV